MSKAKNFLIKPGDMFRHLTNNMVGILSVKFHSKTLTVFWKHLRGVSLLPSISPRNTLMFFTCFYYYTLDSLDHVQRYWLKQKRRSSHFDKTQQSRENRRFICRIKLQKEQIAITRNVSPTFPAWSIFLQTYAGCGGGGEGGRWVGFCKRKN